MKQLSLLVPGLSEQSFELKENFLQGLKALQKFISKAKQISNDKPYIDNLVTAMGLQVPEGNLSIAQMTAAYDNIDVGSYHCLRLDPIELRADLAMVYMYGNRHFSLDAYQKDSISHLVSPLLEEHHMRLITTDSNRWYLLLQHQPQLHSHNPNTLIGRAILNALPKGAQPLNWQRLQTEIEMVLHGNDMLAPVNCLWVWGEGVKLECAMENISDNAKCKALFTDDPMALGLAKLANVNTYPLEDIQTLANCDLDDIQPVVVYDKFHHTLNSEDYLATIKDLDHRMECLFDLLKSKQLDKITLYLMNGCCYELSRIHFYKFWKLKKNLKEVLWKKQLSEESH